MDITYRMSTPSDKEALIKFWSEHAGWGEITEEIWEHRFLKTPLGNAVFALAIDKDEDQIVGQFGFIPSLISVAGEDVKACRPVATIVQEQFRNRVGGSGLQMIILQLYGMATEALREEGVRLIHMVPDPKWLRLFKMAPFFKIAAFPLYQKPVKASADLQLPDGYQLQALDYSDPRIEELWRQARQMYKCMVVRNSTALKWKNSHAKFELTGIVDPDGELAGLFSSIYQDGGKNWIVCDIMSRDDGEALRQTLTGALVKGRQIDRPHQENAHPVENVKLLATPLIERYMADLGMKKEKYKVHLVVHIIDPELSENLAGPEHWYLSQNE